MATKSQPRKRVLPSDPTVQAPFWFLTYHEAVLDGESVTAADAQAKLKDLGYSVSVIRKRGVA